MSAHWALVLGIGMCGVGMAVSVTQAVASTTALAKGGVFVLNGQRTFPIMVSTGPSSLAGMQTLGRAHSYRVAVNTATFNVSIARIR